MQHIRLIYSAGIPPVSRLHMGMGAMSYLSSPLWLLFMIFMLVTNVVSRNQLNGNLHDPTPDFALRLFCVTMAMLLLPKLWAYLLLLRDPVLRHGCGGA